MQWLWCLGLWAALSASAVAQFPARSQALLDQARRANPQRFQFAVDQGAQLLPTKDGASFLVLWTPSPQAPLIVTLHGSASFATDEFFLWHAEAVRAGYGILALQWWFGSGDATEDYYTPADIHRELRQALKGIGTKPGTALLHGFSRGSANLYGVAALDRQSRDRYYAMFVANSGGASVNYPPNVAISSGEMGFNIFAGSFWTMFCGGKDPNPDRDGCPAMRRTSQWVETFGGVTDLFIEDGAAGHGGLHQTPSHLLAALEAFGRSLALHQAAWLTDSVWEVRPDKQFEIAGASIPNVGWVNNEVWLVVGGGGPHRLFRSPDGANSSTWQPLPFTQTALSDSGYGLGEVVPRQNAAGEPVFYVLGLAPPGDNRAALFRIDSNGVRNPSGPVFAGGPEDSRFFGVPDITDSVDGKLRLTYVARGASRSNSRTAISADNGISFQAEFRNPFGDLSLVNPRPSDLNVDPAVLKLSGGGYLALTMRGARLSLFTSLDGRTFVPADQPAIEAGDLAPGATGLFDPTLVQLPDGRIYFYATAGADPGSGSRVVRAEIVRRAPRLTYRGTLRLEAGTIRPEMLAMPGGDVLLVVADRQGYGAGQVKHRAYRYTPEWQLTAAPFAVTAGTDEYGEPADHRVALIKGELVVVYQSLVFRERPGTGTGPAEDFAKDQSLLLARFTLDGTETHRAPIVAHAEDRQEDNFPDFCMVWRGDHLLLSSGNLGGRVKLRRVDLQAQTVETVSFPTSEETVPDNIGNAFLDTARQLYLVSASGPHRAAALSISALTGDLMPGTAVVLDEPEREQHFPVSAVRAEGWTLVGYESRGRSGGPSEQNPYAPYLKVLGEGFRVALDLPMGEPGRLAVHPNILLIGNRLLFAWSESLEQDGRLMPRVRVDEYRWEP